MAARAGRTPADPGTALLGLACIAALVLAGCAGRSDGAPPAPPAAPAPAAADGGGFASAPPAGGFRPPSLVMADGCDVDPCEPTVAADPSGRLYVSTGYKPDRNGLAASSDGIGFTRFMFPPLPEGASPEAVQQDNLVQIAPDGRLAFSAMVSDWYPAGQERYMNTPGLQVAISPDGGATWSSNTFVAIPGAAPIHDRQWLAFGPGEVAYLVFQHIPTGIWAARSDDGGATFAPALPVVTHAARLNVRGSGQPAVDQDGRLFVPYFAVLAPSLADPLATAAVHVAVSEDGGSTFLQRLVALEASDHGLWPMAVTDPGQGVHVSWASETLGAVVAHSTDHAVTWSAPVAWRREGVIAAQTWMVATPEGRLAMAWFAEAKGGHVLKVAQGGPGFTDFAGEDGASASPVLPGTIPSTDFPSIALLPDGAIAAVWAGSADGIFLAVGNAGRG